MGLLLQFPLYGGKALLRRRRPAKLMGVMREHCVGTAGTLRSCGGRNRPSDSSPLSGAGLVVAALLGASYRYFIPPLFLKGKEHFPVLGN